MDRRDFFGATAGALILGPLFGPTVLRYHVPTRTIRKVRLIDVSPIDVESFREMMWMNKAALKTIRKDILSSPSWRMDLIPDDPDGEVIRKKMPVVGEDLKGLIDEFGLRWTENDD